MGPFILYYIFSANMYLFRPGCTNPTRWQQNNLTLHGMWPNYDQSEGGHDWPQCCPSVYGSDLDVTVAKELLAAWKIYWPNEQDPSGGDLSNSLWAHEWYALTILLAGNYRIARMSLFLLVLMLAYVPVYSISCVRGKHGTCSGLDQKTYFETAMNVEISMPTPSAITDNIGGTVSFSTLQRAFNATGCGSSDDCWTGFTCDSQDSDQYLSGITTCWDPDLNQIICPNAVLQSQGTMCSHSTIYIQSF